MTYGVSPATYPVLIRRTDGKRPYVDRGLRAALAVVSPNVQVLP